MITLIDENQFESLRTEYLIIIEVKPTPKVSIEKPKPIEPKKKDTETKKDADDDLKFVIESITETGEVKIRFSGLIAVPSNINRSSDSWIDFSVSNRAQITN
jgi:hypothetical protein